MAEISYGMRLTQLAEQHNNEVAVIYAATDGTDTPITWVELEQRSNQVARLLESHGVGEGDIVVVGVENSPAHLFATFGTWKLGGSVLPLRYDLPAWERDRMLDLAKAKVTIGDWDNGEEDLLTTTALAATTDLPTTPLPDHIPQYARLVATSGSTGRPKIIVTSAPGLIASERTLSQLVGPDTGKTYLTASPLYHTNGFASCYMPLLDDHSVVLMQRFDAERAAGLIEKHRVQMTVMVPTMLQRIARLDDIKSRDFSSIERLVYGGATVPEWVVRIWLDLIGPEHFLLTYGSSEAVGLVSTTGVEWLKRPGTTGEPLDCEIKILDEQGRQLPAREVGEIFMRKLIEEPSFRYIGQETPDPTDDGFRSIGDMGWVDEDGFLYISDRRQDMIITGGANVFPAEIEAALSEHPGLVDFVVIGIPDPEWGHRIHAIVQPADPANPPTEDDLRAHCKDRLASYKVPKGFEVMDQLPRSAAGKINRSALVAERTPGPDSPS